MRMEQKGFILSQNIQRPHPVVKASKIKVSATECYIQQGDNRTSENICGHCYLKPLLSCHKLLPQKEKGKATHYDTYDTHLTWIDTDV